MKKNAVISFIFAIVFVVMAFTSCGEAKPKEPVDMTLGEIMDAVVGECDPKNLVGMNKNVMTYPQLKSAFGMDDELRITECIGYIPELIPNWFIFAIVKTEPGFNTKKYAKDINQHVNKMVQVCTGYPEARAIAKDDVMVIMMGTPECCDNLEAAFNKVMNIVDE